ncbi:MAG: hypothetical protein WC538_16210 [Thermoanaerobaculia bacterium]|jgi:hypothetical protein
MSMQIGREHSLAEEWLPSRFNLAAFRMLGLVVASRVRERKSPATLLGHDPAHHPAEAYSLTCALIAFPSLHLLVDAAPGMALPWLTIPLLVVALPFVAIMAWDIVVFSVALFALLLGRLAGRKIAAIGLQTPVIQGLMLALSGASIALEWRSAWLGWTWLALVALNALCAVALAATRGRVARFSREVTGEP